MNTLSGLRAKMFDLKAADASYRFDDIQLLQAVSDWQRGGDAKQNMRRGQRLKELCKDLPESYRTCILCCFRQIALEKGDVWSLIGESRLAEKISSWTLDLKFAKEFKNGVPPEGQGYQGAIFCIQPPPGSVIVNLSKLYRNSMFCEAMEEAGLAIDGYSDGAGRYWDQQCEVVLEIDALQQDDIYSLGGHSSPVELLIDEAAQGIYGRSATPEERAALLLTAEQAGARAGPGWLSCAATKSVLARTKPKAEALVETKRMQTAS